MPAIKYDTVPTAIGLAKLNNAALLKKPLELTTIKLGDSGGVEYSPTGAETDLKSVVYVGSTNAVEKSKDNAIWADIEIIVPHDRGPFWVREMGVYDKEGHLIFISAIAPRQKLNIPGVTIDMSFIMTVDILKADSVSFVIDPHVTVATRAWVDAKYTSKETSNNDTAIINKDKLHYFTAKGDLQIPDTEGESFRVFVDESVPLSGDYKCRLLAPSFLDEENGKKIKSGGEIGDIANLEEKGVIHTVVLVDGVWKI